MSVLIRGEHYQPKSTFGSQIKVFFLKEGAVGIKTSKPSKLRSQLENHHKDRRIPGPKSFSLQETS
jgi:hypothetical protein